MVTDTASVIADADRSLGNFLESALGKGTAVTFETPSDELAKSMKRPAVFLDRDGVLNAAILRDRRPFPPAAPDELEFVPGATKACRVLAEKGLLLVCVTNQPDIARGTASPATVDALNDAVQRQMGLHHVMVCPHDEADACPCRKPKPGMLLEAASRWNIALDRSVMVGDRWRDVEAGHAAGVATVYIDLDYDEPRPSRSDLTVASLSEAVPWIVARTGRELQEG